MDERCALCGNRTAQMDLDTVAFEGLEIQACPYCRKQLEQTLKNPAQNRDWLQNILQVDTKGVRAEEVTAALTRICYQNDIPRPQNVPVAPPMPAPSVAAVSVPPPVPAASNEAAQPADLEARVAALEKKLQKLQRRILLSKVLGFVIPIVIAVILAIILLQSDSFQNILEYYDQLGELANYM